MNHGHVTLLAIRFMETFRPLDLTVLLVKRFCYCVPMRKKPNSNMWSISEFKQACWLITISF